MRCGTTKTTTFPSSTASLWVGAFGSIVEPQGPTVATKTQKREVPVVTRIIRRRRCDWSSYIRQVGTQRKVLEPVGQRTQLTPEGYLAHRHLSPICSIPKSNCDEDGIRTHACGAQWLGHLIPGGQAQGSRRWGRTQLCKLSPILKGSFPTRVLSWRGRDYRRCQNEPRRVFAENSAV